MTERTETGAERISRRPIRPAGPMGPTGPIAGRARRAGIVALAAGLLAVPLVALPGAAPAQAAPAQAAPAQGRLYVLQGIAGETVSVVVDGRTVASGVAARRVVGPLAVSAGSHAVELRRGTAPIARASVDVAAGSSTDAVAHRFPDAARAPGITTFANDVSAVAPGKTRLLVAHTAVVPPADVLVDGTPLVRNIANGESKTLTVPAGSYSVSIVPTATTGPAVLGPTTLQVKAGTLTNVFAIGDPAAGTMDAIVQVLPVATGGSATPSRVDTGDGGQAAGLFQDRRPAPALPWTALPWTAGAGLLVAAALAVTRPRARAGRR